MNLEQFLTETEQFRANALGAFERAATPEELEAARVQFIGDRSGQLRSIQQALGGLAKEDKPAAGRAFNEAKRLVTESYEQRATQLSQKRVDETGALDLTMPARHQWRGAKHPETLVT